MNEDSSYNSNQPPNPPAPTDATVEEVRRKHIRHEASVKSIGALYYLGAILTILIGISALFSAKEASLGVRITAAAFCISLGLFQFWVARGLCSLKSWTRIPTGILSGIGLLAFPLGTLINACILYLVFSKKGSMVFSPQYRQVIAATPHIKYKTSIVAWVLLGIIIVFIAIVLLIALILPLITPNCFS